MNDCNVVAGKRIFKFRRIFTVDVVWIVFVTDTRVWGGPTRLVTSTT